MLKTPAQCLLQRFFDSKRNKERNASCKERGMREFYSSGMNIFQDHERKLPSVFPPRFKLPAMEFQMQVILRIIHTRISHGLDAFTRFLLVGAAIRVTTKSAPDLFPLRLANCQNNGMRHETRVLSTILHASYIIFFSAALPLTKGGFRSVARVFRHNRSLAASFTIQSASDLSLILILPE